ncbi:pyridoxamine 5'-phosphate oxidase family protein [Microbacterium arabinogalactanolyticum]|uniref:pyridoxamine 5'-phosphate oxidase family protein n=1 Tax=Microbacterium arabinogalactanolyticum TaxID=69365 RepID=UPI00404420ED
MTFDAADRSAVTWFVLNCGAGVVASIGRDAGPQAAFVGLTATDDGLLVLDALESSRKVANIAARPEVAVVVTEGDVTVQLEGRARVSVDDERRRLGAAYDERFPGSRALDEGFVVIAVEVRWVRVYDAGTNPPRVTESDWA